MQETLEQKTIKYWKNESIKSAKKTSNRGVWGYDWNINVAAMQAHQTECRSTEGN